MTNSDQLLFQSLFQETEITPDSAVFTFPELHRHYETIKQLYRLRESCLLAVNVEDVKNITAELRLILAEFQQSLTEVVGDSETNALIANNLVQIEFFVSLSIVLT
jgi:hypothetical protein